VSNFPYGAKNFGCDSPADSAWLMPDRLETFERFDLPGRTVRPVWMTIEIPGTSEPGVYKSNIEINSASDKIVLKVNITVQELVLPDPHKWKFRLDLWQNPWVTARYFKVEPWSEEHKALLKKHLKLYAQAGGKYITTYAVHSPWSDNSYMIEETMIEWIKTTNGLWKFDYSIFDKYVNLAMEAGIDEAITIYTPAWENRFRYLEKSATIFRENDYLPQFKSFWNLFLVSETPSVEELVKKNLSGINENPARIYNRVSGN
jgi:hypothetical protein